MHLIFGIFNKIILTELEKHLLASGKLNSLLRLFCQMSYWHMKCILTITQPRTVLTTVKYYIYNVLDQNYHFKKYRTVIDLSELNSLHLNSR